MLRIVNTCVRQASEKGCYTVKTQERCIKAISTQSNVNVLALMLDYTVVNMHAHAHVTNRVTYNIYDVIRRQYAAALPTIGSENSEQTRKMPKVFSKDMWAQ